MKKALIKISVLIVLLLLMFLLMLNVLLLGVCYKSNYSLGFTANREIKSLLLDATKDQHSLLYNMKKDNIYTKECFLEFCVSTPKSLLVAIDWGFMDSVEKTGEAEYTAVIKAYFPNDDYYHYKIKVIDGNYVISWLGIDP